MNILAINTGSSSVKLCAFGPDERPIFSSEGERSTELRDLLAEVPGAIDIVAHRVVRTSAPVDAAAAFFTDDVERDVRETIEIDPTHATATLDGLEAARAVFADARHVAVFDSAFHRTIGDGAAILGGPWSWWERGYRRLGFHGINHEYCAGRTAELLDRPIETLRTVVAHLGSGCSLAAIAGGHSVDTTMGYTPLEGIMMQTRSGAIDPGLLLYLVASKQYSAADLETLLNRESGLRGLSGTSGDMRAVRTEAAAGSVRAQLALAAFLHRLRGGIAAMTAALGGIDALVFTGGIGEHDAQTRAQTCSGLGFLGVPELGTYSEHGDEVLARGTVSVLKIRAQEELQMARHAQALVA